MRFADPQIKHSPARLVAAFKELPTPILSDVMGRKGAMDGGIRPVDPAMRLVGPAFTVKTPPADNLTCHLALKLARPGDILVVDGGGYRHVALWGELMSLNAQMLGLGGLVIDGAVRDRLALVDTGFAIFSRGCVPAGPFKNNVGALNVPVACGGLSVAPGDLVVGDADGVVVVPRNQADEILLHARDKLAQEESLRRQIAAGHTLYDLLNLDSLLEADDPE